MDSIVHGVAKSQTQLSDFHFTSPIKSTEMRKVLQVFMCGVKHKF